MNMNPNEIKKALECCSDIHFCSVCPYYLQNKENDYCKEDMSKDALAYINQLEAEVERLKADCDKIAEDYSNLIIEKDELFDEAEALIKKAKSEAIKEFAERLKEAFPNNSHWIKPREKVDNLVKEMVGDEE